MNLHARFSTLTILALGLTMHAARTQALDTFDWNAITYAPTSAQAQTQTPLGTSPGGNTISLQFTLNNGATFIPASTTPSPASGASTGNVLYTSGGGSTTQKSLQIGANLANVSQSIDVALFFSVPVTSLTFSLYDIDTNAAGNNGYVDVVSAIIGTTSDNTRVDPQLPVGSANNRVDSVNQITGIASTAQTSGASNATITFDSPTPITKLTFTYGDGYTGTAAHSATQIIALSNMTFTNVPEPGAFNVLMMGAAGLGAVAILRRRRRE